MYNTASWLEESCQTSFLHEVRDHVKRRKLKGKHQNFSGRIQNHTLKHFGTKASTALNSLL